MVIGCLAFLYVSVQFFGGFESEKPQKSLTYELNELVKDYPAFFNFDNLRILVIKRSSDLQSSLHQNKLDYWDVNSAKSNQPDYAKNRLRSKVPEYFVAVAMGTDFVCPIIVADSSKLIESCNPKAQYDFAGRGLITKGANKFKNLHIPEYEFNKTFSRLTIYF